MPFFLMIVAAGSDRRKLMNSFVAASSFEPGKPARAVDHEPLKVPGQRPEDLDAVDW